MAFASSARAKIFQAGHYHESQIAGGVQERRRGEFPVDHHVPRKAFSHSIDDPPQDALLGGIRTIPGPVGFHIAGQG